MSATAGLRAWLPLLLAGLAVRTGWLEVGPSFAFLAGTKALFVFAAATLIEMVADKVPVVDHALDALGTPLKLLAGALLAAAAFGTVTDPLTSLALGVAVGTPTALVPHAAKSLLRLTSTALTGGLANPVISLLEDVATFAFFVLAVLAAHRGGRLRPPRGGARRPATAARHAASRPKRRVRRHLAPGLAAAGLVLLLLAARGNPARAGPARHHHPAPPPVTQPPFVIEADVNVVSVTAVIFDKAGRFVPGLGTKDVELLEDGVKQEVTYFREASAEGEGERIPLSVVLVLDTSGSMVPNMRFLQEAATNFLYKLEETDTAMVVSFNESVKGSTEFTSDFERLEQSVNGLQAWGGTSLYDAVHYSLGRVKDQPGRKAVVVFSDGADTTSTSFNDQGVVDYAQGGGSHHLRHRVPRRPRPLRLEPTRGSSASSCDETGGAFFFPDKIGELNKIFNLIANELKSHYLLSYSPQRSPDGSFRAISLRLVSPKAKDYEVRVRKGYFAMKRSRPPARPR